MAKYKVGSLIRVISDNECYDGFRDQVLEITHVSTSIHDHPGYDSSMKGEGLYDFVDAETGIEIPCSLYDYELTEA